MANPDGQFSGGQWDDLLDFGTPATTRQVATLPTTQADVTTTQFQRRSVEVGVPLVRGQLPGKPKGITFEVRLAQLKKADHPLRLYYDPNEDDQLVEYAESLKQLGDPLYPLVCLPTEEVIDVDGEVLPRYDVYHDVRVFHAHIINSTPWVTIFVYERQDPGEVLLKTLDEQESRRPLTLLELADNVRYLHEVCRYDQGVIAGHLSQSDDGAKPDQPYVSRLISISKQPDPIRQMAHAGHLKATHLRYLSERFPGKKNEPDRILMARYVVKHELSARDMQKKISEWKGLDGIGARIKLIDGPHGVSEQRIAAPMSPDRPAAPQRNMATIPYWQRPQRLVAPASNIRRAAQEFHITIVPHEKIEHAAMTVDSLNDLRDWIDGLTSQRVQEVEIAVVEAKIVGMLEATRQTMVAANLIEDIKEN
jgi:hypothetical protein